MKEPNFEFNKEGVTLEWQQEGSIVGYVRVHTGNVPNSPVSYSCAVELYKDGTFEFKILKKEHEEITIDVRKTILRPISKYLGGLGYKGQWSRRKENFTKEVNVRDSYHDKDEDSKG